MKPTKMRNNMIYRATCQTKSKQLGSALSKELQKKYGKRSVRVVEGDNVTIVRGEFAGVDGKVAQISTQKSSVAIEGIKKEQTRGEKYDVYIHTSNLAVKSLNTDDKWRMAKLEGKDPRNMPKTTPKETKAEESKETVKETPKEIKAEEKSKKKEDED
ncbi:MAG: 50S ribosomal protein L24 [Nitrosopumilus sp. (ex Thoosa mismalolli)]|nr:50S ribosomal protein L24 [Nitrosopumilus sp. (ex Thoosa mismalolli)]